MIEPTVGIKFSRKITSPPHTSEINIDGAQKEVAEETGERTGEHFDANVFLDVVADSIDDFSDVTLLPACAEERRDFIIEPTLLEKEEEHINRNQPTARKNAGE